MLSYKIIVWQEIYNSVVSKKKYLEFESMFDFVLAANRNYLAAFIELFPYCFSRTFSCILGLGIKKRTDSRLDMHFTSEFLINV